MIFLLLLRFGLILIFCADAFLAGPAPKDKKADVTFYCIHSSDTVYKEISINDKSISEKLDLTLEFAFFVHGWQSEFDITKKDSLPCQIGLEWVKAKKTNFCGVNWSRLADDGYYDASQKHVKEIGTQLALFIQSLNNQYKVKMDLITIAGHSLGGHIAGFAGRRIYELLGSKIATIFGLDPAGPFFTVLTISDFHLNKNDANFVQVLHTSSGTFGTKDNIGHADFIANGGKLQEKCVKDLLKADDLLFKCSHTHAKEIFLASFKYSCNGVLEKPTEPTEPTSFFEKIKNFFTKNKLSKVTDLYGIHNHGVHGVFDLDTHIKAPYCEKA